MGESFKGITEVHEDNIPWYSLIHQAGHFIIEGYEVDQAWFSLIKCMLTTSDYFLVFHVFQNAFQEDFLHRFSADRGEIDETSVPCIFLRGDRSDILF